MSAALDAQPGTKHVYVISGIAAFDKLYADLFRLQRTPFAGRVTFHDLAGLTVPDLEARVRQLPPDSIIYYLSVSDDGAGHTVMPLDAIDPIAAAANAPVYSWHEDALGHGIVGGRLHSSVQDARETARIALRVLRGEKPEDIPVTEFDSYTFHSTGVNSSDGRSAKPAFRRTARSVFGNRRSSSGTTATSLAARRSSWRRVC